MSFFVGCSDDICLSEDRVDELGVAVLALNAFVRLIQGRLR